MARPDREQILGAARTALRATRRSILDVAHTTIAVDRRLTQGIEGWLDRPFTINSEETHLTTTRRQVAQVGAVVAVAVEAAFLGGVMVSDQRRNRQQLYRPGVVPSAPKEAAPVVEPPHRLFLEMFPEAPSIGGLQPNSLPFYNRESNGIATQLNLHAGSFFNIPKEVYPKLKAFAGKELSDGLPPAVYEYTGLIYRLSEKHNIPPTVVGTIITLESAGREDAQSNSSLIDKDDPYKDLDLRAQGLFGVMPMHFKSRGYATIGQMQDPEINGEIAMQEFTYFLKIAREAHKGATEAEIYARALMGYNGGNLAATAKFDDSRIKDESRFYFDHVMRFFLTAEVAARMKSKYNYSDKEVASRLFSPETDARVMAFYLWHAGMLKNFGHYTYEQYAKIKETLGKQVITINGSLPNKAGELLFNGYIGYLKQTSKGWQTSPGLEIWMGMGGRYLFNQESRNTDPDKWLAIDTKSRKEQPKTKEKQGKIVMFDQTDPRWAKDSQGRPNPDWVGITTCGPTTTAMVLATFGEDTNPAKIDEIFRRRGFRPAGGGATFMRVTGVKGKEGGVLGWFRDEKKYEVEQLYDNHFNPEKRFSFDEAKRMLDQGYLIVASGNVKANWISDFPGEVVSHIFGVNEVDIAKRRFMTFDPWKKMEAWRSLDDMEYFAYAYALKPLFFTGFASLHQHP